MPELCSHLACAHILRRGEEVGRKRLWPGRSASLFYLGALLPDLLAKPASIVSGSHQIYWFFAATESPLVVLIIAYAVVMILPGPRRWENYRVLMAGCLLHWGLDLLQKHLFGGSYYWLFPFSWKTFNLPLFWPSDSILFIPFELAIILLIEYRIMFKNPRIQQAPCHEKN